MLGPTGIGVLWARKEILQAMPPFLGGGDMIKSVHLRESEWNDIPHKFEAGTPNIAHGIGLGAAVDYLNGLGMENVQAHEQAMAAYALERLAAVPNLHIYGPPAGERGGVVTFNLMRDGELLDPSPRPGQHPGSGGDRHPRRAPLRPAADGALWRAGHRAGQFLRVQHRGRSGPAGRCTVQSAEYIRTGLDD